MRLSLQKNCCLTQGNFKIIKFLELSTKHSKKIKKKKKKTEYIYYSK